MQVSAIIIGDVLDKKGLFSLFQRPYGDKCYIGWPLAYLSAAFSALPQNVATHVVAPSTLSHMCSRSLQACVLTIFDYYLSQESKAKFTNSLVSLCISSASY